jgi:hypothetical protein
MTIWRMRIACWITKAANAHSEYGILIRPPLQQLVQSAPQCCVIRTLPVMLNYCALLPFPINDLSEFCHIVLHKYIKSCVYALRYKPTGRGFNSRWCHWNFSVTSFRSHYGPGVDSASNRNEYQVYLLGVKAAGA